MRTHLWVLRHPLTCWDSIRVLGADSNELLWVSLMLAGLTGVIPGSLVAIRHIRESINLSISALIVLIGIDFCLVVGWTLFSSILVVIAGLLLTSIERLGVRLFGSRRGWRITDIVARTVCGHAAGGWILAFVCLELGLTWPIATDPFGRAGSLISKLSDELWIASLSLSFAGMLLFETLVYLGVRRMRYANAPREQPPRESDPG